MGHNIDAIPLLEKAISIDNSNLEVLEILAILYEEIGNKDRAEELYQEILLLDSENKSAAEGIERLEKLASKLNENIS